MRRGSGEQYKNLFEIDNARDLPRQDLVDTFVPTPAFWRLLSAKNQIVLGARGSGKTALAKMLSYDHLSLYKDKKIGGLVTECALCGIYIPTRLEWVGGLRNKKWRNEQEQEEYFQWRMNLISCSSLANTLQSILDVRAPHPLQRALWEDALVAALTQDWQLSPNARTLRDIQRALQDLEYEMNLLLVRKRISSFENSEEPGAVFRMELFAPLKRGIVHTQRILELPQNNAWLLCIDEAEYLDEVHHRILNSHMRSFPECQLFFKLTTQPYCHYTLETNIGVPLNVGHDFEYVYIDVDPVDSRRTGNLREYATEGTPPGVPWFAKTLFSKRAIASGLKRARDGRASSDAGSRESPLIGSMGQLFGSSEILDAEATDWSNGSAMFALLERHATKATLKRARRLAGTNRFGNAIGRKIHGALILREALWNQRGQQAPDVYSGASMIVRCSDLNPRRLVRLFNVLLLHGTDRLRPDRWEPISRADQTRILRKFSSSTLERVQSEPERGGRMFKLLGMLGSYMHDALHKRRISTDQVGSVSFGPETNEDDWATVRAAVGIGLLFPNQKPWKADDLPMSGGEFRMAYVLAPHFFILPRRGKARSVAEMELWAANSLHHAGQSRLWTSEPNE